MEQKGFIFYEFYHKSLKNLTNKQRLKLMDAVCKYAFEGKEPTFDDEILKAMFILMKDTIKVVEVEL